ncbi:hypothetical protein, variant [Allomyces macrogynus ATCC 38327]|uniref:C3H1-type domain-containing protein n=1 Tax=Allomyces macrogynus (strain ATCC 38327) TaxID=578462 RepID=A0A0L0T3H0_ALLM3|nr:hypothetical protein, variant [Allomyces macrogynus ATCC 38327]|eukprot:KNE69104.1 hypothetical protein, variant [Allomyces macrogynus ATCC 38327]
MYHYPHSYPAVPRPYMGQSPAIATAGMPIRPVAHPNPIAHPGAYAVPAASPAYGYGHGHGHGCAMTPSYWPAAHAATPPMHGHGWSPSTQPLRSPAMRPGARAAFRNMTLVRQQPTTDSAAKTPTATAVPKPPVTAPAPSLPSSNPTPLAKSPIATPSTTPPLAFSSARASPAPGTPPSATVQYVRHGANQLVRKDLISSPSPAPSSLAGAAVTPATPTPSTSPPTTSNSQFLARGRSLIRKEALRPTATTTPRGSSTPTGSTTTGSTNSNYVQTSKGSLVRRDLVREPAPARLFSKCKSNTGPVILRGKIVTLNGANYVQGQDGKLTRLEPGKFIVRNSTNPKAKHCTYFQRFGTCSRGTACALIHDPVCITLCRFALFGRDHDATRCKHNHTLTAHNTPHCAHFQRGACTNAACKFIHAKPAPGAPVCRNFLDGYCPHGAQCTARHVWECPQGTACSNGKCRWQHPGPRKRRAPAVGSPGSVKRARLDEADELPILFRDKDEYWDLGDTSDEDEEDVEVTVDQSEDGEVELEWFDTLSGSGSPTSSDRSEAMDEDGGNQDDLILLDDDSDDEEQEDGEFRDAENDGGLDSAE